MTLLIGTASDEHVLLTADRRCNIEEYGTVLRIDTYQKIFPIPGKPLAIVHHGENVLLDENDKKTPLQEFLTTFIRDNADVFEQTSIASITKKLTDKLESTAQHTLRNRGEMLIGFWIAGFAIGRAKPEIYETCWFKNGQKELNQCHNLVVGGDGQEHLPHVCP